MFIVFFFLLGAFFLISNYNLHINDKEEAHTLFELYFNWVIGMGKNVVELTGNAVKFDWLPSSNVSNVSNSSK